MIRQRRVAIFFDIGHTLAVGGEMSPRRLIGYRLGLSEENMKALGKFIMTTPIETKEDLCKAIEPFAKHLNPDTLRALVTEVWEEQESCVEILSGAEEVIRTLAEKGYELGLISNIWHPFYEGVRRKSGDFWHYFKYVVLSYRVGIKKPDSRIYRMAYEQAKADECWMIGDTYEMDVIPAKAEGFKTVWFLVRPEKERETLAKVLRRDIPAPDFAIADLRELIREDTFLSLIS